MEKKQINYGKKIITKVDGARLTETSRTYVAGAFVPPSKVRLEESIEVHNRAEQDAEYIHFSDEEEQAQAKGNLIEAEFQIRRTPASSKRGTWYVVKKFTYLDSRSEYGV